MKKLSTRIRNKTQVSFYIDEEMSELFGEKFLEGLESQIQNGEVFQVGETYQIGWMLTRFVSNGGGGLELFEPDFEAQLNINWRRGLNRTGRFSTIGYSVCNELELEPEMCHLGSDALVEIPPNADASIFQMNRTEQGWEIHLGPAMEEGIPMQMTLYQSALRQPRLIPFFLLPTGTKVRVTPNSIAIQYLGKPLSIPEEGYIDNQFVLPETERAESNLLEVNPTPTGPIKAQLKEVLSRRAYAIGEFIELGWFWFRISKADPVEVETLDCQAMAAFTKDLSRVESIDALQKRTLDAHGLTAQPCSYMSTAMLSVSYNPGRKDLFIQRGYPGEVRDSGWYIGVENEERDMNDPKSFVVKSLYEISLRDDRILPYWLFPIGKRIAFRSGSPRVKSFDPSA